MAAFDPNTPLAQVGRCSVCLATRHLDNELCSRCSTQVTPRVAQMVRQARRNPHVARLCSERLTGAARDEFFALLGSMPGLVGPSISKCAVRPAGPRPVRYPVLKPAVGE
ncbi:MAG: hypothetical protein H6718_31015 [Polyangiaceae bacterium]|nr:hypothetical protein [Myxococcales bacterium]MCB9589887.1 hypothetical protein [Polyangiaceae bacterium]